ncbi:MAG TPA: hypothetical protein VJW20_12210 [Candidatus Angelobacter sp.]|nr:hypothetical protein [Candidatus Angelobacter sp.]
MSTQQKQQKDCTSRAGIRFATQCDKSIKTGKIDALAKVMDAVGSVPAVKYSAEAAKYRAEAARLRDQLAQIESQN